MGVCDSGKINDIKLNNNEFKENKKINNKINQVFIQKKDEYGKDIPEEELITKIDKNFSQTYKSICKIELLESKMSGNGFLLNFEINEEPFFWLITNEHIINMEIIESKKTIDLYYDFGNQSRKIKLDINQRIIKDYKDFDNFKDLDITIIQILDIDNIEEHYFLSLSLDYKGDLTNKKIYIPKYSEENNLNYLYAEIKEINGYEIKYDAKTIDDFSGSPIFLENSTEVIGIQKKVILNINYGSFIYPIINVFNTKGMLNELESQKYEGFHKNIYDNGDYYEGEWKKGLRNGKGKLFNKIGKLLYEGDWINDKQEGSGKSFFDNGDYYIGQFKNSKKNGKVKLFKKNGNLLYEGIFREDKLEKIEKFIFENGNYWSDIKSRENYSNGKGKLYNKDGFLLYEGDFVDFKFEGNGRYNYLNGEYYIGNWKNNLRNGKGSIYDKNANLKYDGEWVNDIIDIDGKIVYEDGSYYIGTIKKGKKHGRGQLFSKNNKIKYDGNWVDDQFKRGVMISENGESYSGDYLNNLPNGKGKIYLNDKVLYTGDFIQGKFEGFGMYYNDNGDYYIGEWKNGMKNGNGKVFNKNHKLLYKGNWVNDKMI